MLADGEAELAFGLGDLEAGDPEAEGFQDVGLDLVVGGLCLGSGQVGVLQVEGHADGHIRIFSDQLNNRLDMSWDNSVNKMAHIYAAHTTLDVRNMPLTN